MPVRTLAGALAAIVMVSGGCGRAAENAAVPPARVSIEISVTPGKPGAPTETASVAWADSAATITVSRGSVGAAGESETAPLPAADFRQLWATVEKERLIAFSPKPRKDQTFDFGTRTLKIDLRPAAAAKGANNGKTFNSVEWDKPIANGETVEKLFSSISKLAAKHCKKVPLNYIR